MQNNSSANHLATVMHTDDDIYKRLNRYRRGSSEMDDVVEPDEEVFKGRLMTTSIEPHDADRWSLSEAQVPRLLRRRYIMRGYRIPHASTGFYCCSALWMHNETINVWTHAVPFVYYAITFTRQWMSESLTPLHYPLFTLQLCTLALLLSSTTAHLLHSRSKMHHIFWFLIDFLTISTFIMGIGVQRYYQELNARILLPNVQPTPIQYTYIPFLMVTSFAHYAVNGYLFVHHTYMTSRVQMRLPTSLLAALFLYIPLLPRYTWYAPVADLFVYGDGRALTAHARAFAWLLASGIFMGGHVPERFARGTFDLFGYGHQIFHVCVVFVADNLLHAARHDLDALRPLYSSSTELSSWSDMVAAMSALLSLNLITMWYLIRTGNLKHA